ncbi:MAG TPA: alpha/beta hydrolase [Rhizomicrobium sp.]|jgi:pimeloyl-ACP methyl ester carboxylesterase|nr:alpha/beta hydrolase [Rhizomicrobium sp.]
MTPLLLLPGMLCDAASWRAQTDALGGDFEIDVARFGDAGDIVTMARSVLAAAPERFALAGHSMGGRVALALYRMAPERVTHLGLFATDFRGHADAAAEAGEAARRDGMLARVAAVGLAEFARGWAKQVVSPSRLDDAALLEAIATMMARHTPVQLAAQTLAGLNRPDFADLVPRIGCPTLLIAGEDDALRPPAVHSEMAGMIGGSELLVLPRTGHMVAMEEPAAVTAAMRRWLGR